MESGGGDRSGGSDDGGGDGCWRWRCWRNQGGLVWADTAQGSTSAAAKKSVSLITERSLTFAEVFADRSFVRSRRSFDLLIERNHLSIGTPMPRPWDHHSAGGP